MEIIDERENGKDITFDGLCIGDCFVDKEGDICIKTGEDSGIYTTNNRNWHSIRFDADDKVVPLDATLTIKKKN